jgi:hypothetical protein
VCYAHSYDIRTIQFTVQLSLLVFWQHWSNESRVRQANTIIILLGSYNNAGGFQPVPVFRSFYPASILATLLSWRQPKPTNVCVPSLPIRVSREASAYPLKYKVSHLFLKANLSLVKLLENQTITEYNFSFLRTSSTLTVFLKEDFFFQLLKRYILQIVHYTK